MTKLKHTYPATAMRMLREMQQGFLEMTELRITALYPKEEVVEQARSRIRAAQQVEYITSRVGKIGPCRAPMRHLTSLSVWGQC